MIPDHSLSVLGAIAGFALKTTLGFAACIAAARLIDSPSRRFALWFAYLFGAASYWVWLAANIWRGAGPSAIAGNAAASPSLHPFHLGVVRISDAWTLPLGAGLRVLGAAYLFALGYFLLAEIRSGRHLRWALSFATAPPAEIAESFDALAASLNAPGSKLMVLSGTASPATFGWVRPIILIPSACLDQKRLQLEDILRHELFHVRRRDFVWDRLAAGCRAMLFFHPAFWYALRRMRADRELACDSAVVSRFPGRSADYAESLVHFARLPQTEQPNWGIDFAPPAESLSRRVRSILAERKRRPRWLAGIRAISGAALAGAFLSIVPSLAVAVSYVRLPQFRLSSPAPAASLAPAHPKQRIPRRRLAHPRPVLASEFVTARGDIENRPADDPGSQPAPQSASSQPQLPSPAVQAPGPQLLRRSSQPKRSGDAPPRGTIVLVDGNSGDSPHGRRNDAFRQSAVAAGLAVRLAALKDGK